MSWEIVEVERMSPRDAHNWRHRKRKKWQPPKSVEQLAAEVREERRALSRSSAKHRAAWAAENSEKMKASRQKWREKNPGYDAQWLKDRRARQTAEEQAAEAERKSEWAKANRERRNAARRARSKGALKTPEQRAAETARKMRWIAKNVEHVRAYQRARYAANRERINAARRKGRTNVSVE